MKAIALPLVVALALVACGQHEDDHERQPKAKNELELIRNTEKIGYSGGAVADKVQGAIDANKGRPEHLEQAQGWAGGVEGEDDDSSSSKDTE
jgi:hypothetical protein